MLQNRLFFALASRSGFGPAISDPVARSSIVFCNSVLRLVRSKECEVRSVKEAVRSEKCEVWTVKFGV